MRTTNRLPFSLPAAALLAFLAVSTAASAAPRSWALIVNGDDSETHGRNVEIALDSLAALGFEADSVLLLAPAPFTGPRAPAWQARARKGDLDDALAHLAELVGPEDVLLVYLTGHGARRFGDSVLVLERGAVGARTLARRLAGLRFGRLVLVADQCYSGGFLDALRDERRPVVALAATDPDHEVRCEPFIRPFWRAAVDRRHDRDGDGRVSVEEAFAVAEASARRGVSKGGSPRLVHTAPVTKGGTAFHAVR